MPDDGEVVRQGEVPFIQLPDGSVVMARFVTTFVKARASWHDDTESTSWTFTLSGRELEVIGDEEHPWVPIDDRRARGQTKPMTAHADGGRFAVTYHYYFAHHYGSLSGDVMLEIDPIAMTITVVGDLKFEDG